MIKSWELRLDDLIYEEKRKKKLLMNTKLSQVAHFLSFCDVFHDSIRLIILDFFVIADDYGDDVEAPWRECLLRFSLPGRHNVNDGY